MAIIMGEALSTMAAANFAAINLALVTISGGTFMMGSTDDDTGGDPVHQVELDAFRKGVYPVTNDNYGRFVGRLGQNRFVRIGLDPRTGLERVFALGDNEGQIDQLTGEELLGEVTSNMAVVNGLGVFADITRAVLDSFRTARIEDHRPPSRPDAPRQPVNVNWSEALAFANLLGLRLSTEAEWEFAACVRPDDGLRKYAIPSDVVCEAHHQVDERNAAFPNSLPLMGGRFLEWLQDWYGRYSEGQVTNPVGPLSGQFKVLRGSLGRYGPPNPRQAWRGTYHPDKRYLNVGFQVAGSPQDSVG